MGRHSKKDHKKEELINSSIIDNEEIKIEPIISIDPQTGETVYNNWTRENTETIAKWKRSVAKTSYSYDFILEIYKKKLNKNLLWALIFSTITSIVSAISAALLTIDDTNYKWVAFALNIIIFIVSGTVSILNGKIKIHKWDDFVAKLCTFVEKLDNFYVTISSELVLSPKLRHDAEAFIRQHDKDYSSIMQQAPDAYPSELKLARDDYENFMSDNSINTKFANKFRFGMA